MLKVNSRCYLPCDPPSHLPMWVPWEKSVTIKSLKMYASWYSRNQGVVAHYHHFPTGRHLRPMSRRSHNGIGCSFKALGSQKASIYSQGLVKASCQPWQGLTYITHHLSCLQSVNLCQAFLRGPLSSPKSTISNCSWQRCNNFGLQAFLWFCIDVGIRLFPQPWCLSTSWVIKGYPWSWWLTSKGAVPIHYRLHLQRTQFMTGYKLLLCRVTTVISVVQGCFPGGIVLLRIFTFASKNPPDTET